MDWGAERKARTLRRLSRVQCVIIVEKEACV
jgi:hypothetical protein